MEPATWVVLASAIFALVVWLAARGGPTPPLLPRWDDRPTLPPVEDASRSETQADEPSAPAPPAPVVVVGRREITGAPHVFIRKHRRPPFVLAHGFGGFRALGVGPLKQHYFRGVPRALERLGFEVHVPKVPAVAPIAERARVLVEQIARIDADRVHLIAHSMGGLDVRHAVAHLGLGPRVASLVTVATPHRGTPLADVGLSVLGREGRVLTRERGCLTDLSPSRAHDEYLGVPDVPTASVIARPSRVSGIMPPLLPSYALLSRLAGPNDGVVPASSQRFGKVLGEIDTDHWGSVGWSPGFDAAGFYLALARTLVRALRLRRDRERVARVRAHRLAVRTVGARGLVRRRVRAASDRRAIAGDVDRHGLRCRHQRHAGDRLLSRGQQRARQAHLHARPRARRRRRRGERERGSAGRRRAVGDDGHDVRAGRPRGGGRDRHEEAVRAADRGALVPLHAGLRRRGASRHQRHRP